jgi:hypothetical protein
MNSGPDRTTRDFLKKANLEKFHSTYSFGRIHCMHATEKNIEVIP